MKIGVCGFGHLAQVTAVCLGHLKHEIVQYDAQPWLLRADQDVSQEPGWLELAQSVWIERTDRVSALAACDLVWVAYDTPLFPDGRGDDQAVVARVRTIADALPPGNLVILSSQWVVGTTRDLERAYPLLDFVYVPENLRAEKAVRGFQHQDRVVIGTRRNDHHVILARLVRPLTERVLWMSIESAELSKHALNAWVAMNIAFGNEIATYAQFIGASPKEVTQALLSDYRVGPKAPIQPGAPFAGGSLARDLVTLQGLGLTWRLETPLLSSILLSNEQHAKGALVSP